MGGRAGESIYWLEGLQTIWDKGLGKGGVADRFATIVIDHWGAALHVPHLGQMVVASVWHLGRYAIGDSVTTRQATIRP